LQNPLSILPTRLLPWFAQNARPLPWRQDRRPYHVWLSEIMLQQTRVEAVWNYYLRFLAALPTVEDLAAAEEDKLAKVLENPSVIRTPVVRNGKQSTIGYRPEIWKGWN
jgi:A/G-specific adenine glycosylase